LANIGHLVSEPLVERCAPSCVRDQLDSEANLGEGHRADVQRVERRAAHERDDFAARLWPAQLGQHIGVEQPAAQASRAEPAAARGGAISTSWWGDARIADTSAAPRAIALEAAKLFRGNDHGRVSSVHGDVLRSLAFGQSNHLTQPCLGVAQT
jgi:hypothetical protein